MDALVVDNGERFAVREVEVPRPGSPGSFVSGEGGHDLRHRPAGLVANTLRSGPAPRRS